MSEEFEPDDLHGMVEECRDEGYTYTECMLPPIGDGIGIVSVLGELLVGVGSVVAMLFLIALVVAAFGVGVYGTARTVVLVGRSGVRAALDRSRVRYHARECCRSVYWMVTWTVAVASGLYVAFVVLGFLIAALLGGAILFFGVGDREMRAEYFDRIGETLASHNPVVVLQGNASDPAGAVFLGCLVASAVFAALHWYGRQQGLETPPAISDVYRQVRSGVSWS